MRRLEMKCEILVTREIVKQTVKKGYKKFSFGLKWLVSLPTQKGGEISEGIKGQLISKGLFVFSILPKNERKISSEIFPPVKSALLYQWIDFWF